MTATNCAWAATMAMAQRTQTRDNTVVIHVWLTFGVVCQPVGRQQLVAVARHLQLEVKRAHWHLKRCLEAGLQMTMPDAPRRLAATGGTVAGPRRTPERWHVF
jgi:hypothetical protein